MVFVGGSLKLKGDNKKSKKGKKKKSKHSHRSREEVVEATSEGQRRSSREEDEEDGDYDDRKGEIAAAAAARGAHDDGDDDDGMTEAERKALKYKLEAEKKDMAKVAKQSHRERVEVFSQKLSELTELNDIPRVSAAGNG